MPTVESAQSQGGPVIWPVRSGSMPALADGFSARPETAPGVGATLIQGTSVVLVPGRPGADGGRDWPASCGMTQIAVHLAETLWHSREVDLLVWVTASSRASVLAGYVEAAATALGADPAGDAESVASRLVGWLTETTRPWLVVLDDLTDPADLEGLWPAGPDGPGAHHDSQPDHAAGREPGQCPARRAIQPARVTGLPDGPAHRRPGPAARGYRPGEGPELRAAGACSGQLSHRQLGPVLPGLPRLLCAAAGSPGRR